MRCPARHFWTIPLGVIQAQRHSPSFHPSRLFITYMFEVQFGVLFPWAASGRRYRSGITVWPRAPTGPWWGDSAAFVALRQKQLLGPIVVVPGAVLVNGRSCVASHPVMPLSEFCGQCCFLCFFPADPPKWTPSLLRHPSPTKIAPSMDKIISTGSKKKGGMLESAVQFLKYRIAR